MEHVDLIQTIVLLALVVSNRVLKLRIKKLEEFRDIRQSGFTNIAQN